jgi:ubiquinone/menaquinone biosynthesis C-methylase UbiE
MGVGNSGAPSVKKQHFPYRTDRDAMRAWIYDQTFVGLTVGWYREVLKRLPRGARLLDVGIGTGGALVRNADLVKARNLHVVGVDIDSAYLRRCRKLVAEAGLARHVAPMLESIYDHRGGPYDAVYFSASFMLLPDPVGALRHTVQMLAPGGRVYFTQTIHTRRAPVMEKVKPMLHRLTTIHFGRVTYEHELVDVVRRAGLHLHQWHNLGGARDLRFCLAMAKPSASALESEVREAVEPQAAVA